MVTAHRHCRRSATSGGVQRSGVAGGCGALVTSLQAEEQIAHVQMRGQHGYQALLPAQKLPLKVVQSGLVASQGATLNALQRWVNRADGPLPFLGIPAPL